MGLEVLGTKSSADISIPDDENEDVKKTYVIDSKRYHYYRIMLNHGAANILAEQTRKNEGWLVRVIPRTIVIQKGHNPKLLKTKGYVLYVHLSNFWGKKPGHTWVPNLTPNTECPTCRAKHLKNIVKRAGSNKK